MNNKKVVIITGGNKGIGLGITKKFVESGYFVIIGARSSIEIEKKYHNNISFIKSDVTDEKSHIKLVNEAIKNHGRLDCYINNSFSA